MAGRSRKSIRIKEIMDRKGRGIQVLLAGGQAIWLPARLVNIKLNDQGERLIDMPAWLYNKKKHELTAGSHT